MKVLSRCFLGISTLVLYFSFPVLGQELPLKWVPADSPVIVQLKGLGTSRNNLGKMVGNAFPDLAPKWIDQVNKMIKDGFDGRKLDAINDKEPIIAFMPSLEKFQDSNNWVVILPVKSYESFCDTIMSKEEKKSLKKGKDGKNRIDEWTVEGKDDPLALIDRKTHVLIAGSSETAQSLLKAKATIEKKIADEVKSAFTQSDLSIYINIQSIYDAFKDQIDGFRGLVNIVLSGAGGQGLDKKQIEMIKSIVKTAINTVEDSLGLMMGLEFRPEGLSFKVLGQVRAESDTNKFLKDFKTSSLNELNQLPNEQMMYGVSQSSEKLNKALKSLTQLATDEDEKANDKILKALERLFDSGETIEVTCLPDLKKEMKVTTYKDAKKAVDALSDMFKSLTKTGQFNGAQLKDKPIFKEKAEKIGDIEFNYFSVKFDLDKILESNQQLPDSFKEAMKTMMTSLLGEELKMWYGLDGNQVITLRADKFETAKKLYEQYKTGKNSLANNPGFQLTRKNLPEKATSISMINTSKFVAFFVDIVRATLNNIPGAPISIPELTSVKGNAAYTGVAVVIKPSFASFELFVPTTAMQQIRSMFAPLLAQDD